MMNSPIIVPVILSGGMGSRLWPMSRKKYPKQFLSLGGAEGSMLQETARRVSGEGFSSKPMVVCNEDHRFLVAEHMLEAGFSDVDIMLEPEGRNTAPAIAAAAFHINKHYDNALMLVLASDHLINDKSEFLVAVDHAAKAAAQGRLVTFGIKPEYPETGYGYIQRGSELDGLDGAYNLAQFVEKPDSETAQSYLDAGDYVWNSGMFMLPVNELLFEMGKLQPEVFSSCKTAVDKANYGQDFIRLDADNFSKAPDISVDYAVMEKTKNAAVVPVDCGWSDAGAWDSLWRIGEKKEGNNVVHGEAYTEDAEGCYLHVHDGPAISVLGVDDVVVVSTRDSVMVTKKDKAQDVKKMMKKAEASNPQLSEHHLRVYRPWGFYETLALGELYQVKHIQVKPGAKLSVQMHYKRAEHWVLVDGTAKMYLDDKEYVVKGNDHVYIPIEAVHSIENIGDVPVNFIEVQRGTYLGEDDIVRFEDMYGREGTNS